MSLAINLAVYQPLYFPELGHEPVGISLIRAIDPGAKQHEIHEIGVVKYCADVGTVFRRINPIQISRYFTNAQ